MIARWTLYVEAHRGRLPRVSLRRVPRPGDRVVDGGLLGTLVRCPECGDGFLHQPDADALAAAQAGVLPDRGDEGPLVVRVPSPAALAAVRRVDASDQGVRALGSPAGKNDLARRPAVEVAQVAAFGLHGVCPSRGTSTYPAVRCPGCIAEAVVAGLAAEGLLVEPAPAEAPDPDRVTNTFTEPDEVARAHPLHAVITAELRRPGGRGRAPADRVWGRWYGAMPDVGAEGNLWAGDPEDVADGIIRALTAARPGLLESAAAWGDE